MATLESVEYYSACPQCGAANIGKEKCDYCGTSLVKSRTNTNIGFGYGYVRNEEEEANFQSDSEYPVIKGKIYEIDSFLLFFCLFFGGMFLLVPTIILLAFSSSGIMEPWIYLMLILFWLIGIGGLSPLVISLFKRLKCKKGNEISGIVRGYEESMVTVNGRPVLNVRLLINERTDPKILVLYTGKNHKEYALGRVIRLRGYNNNFIIEKEKL